jgi:uncharacterized protein (TIGR00369 family)
MRFFEMNAHTRQDEKEESMYLKIFKERINKSPAYRFLGMKVTDISRGYSCLELDCREEIKNVQGLIHGGIICTLMDSSCGVALGSLLEPEEPLLTLDLRINYISPHRKGVLIGEGAVLHMGQHTGVAESTIKDGQGKLIAKGMTTHFLKRRTKQDRKEE